LTLLKRLGQNITTHSLKFGLLFVSCIPCKLYDSAIAEDTMRCGDGDNYVKESKGKNINAVRRVWTK